MEFPPNWSPGVPKACGLGRGFPIFFVFGFLFASQFSRMFFAVFGSFSLAFWNAFGPPDVSKTRRDKTRPDETEVKREKSATCVSYGKIQCFMHIQHVSRQDRTRQDKAREDKKRLDWTRKTLSRPCSIFY